MKGMRSITPMLASMLFVAMVLPVAAEEPMRDEDVVRMVIQGIPHEDIVAEIRARPPAFDLSDEMVDELKIAGVPGSLIAEMRRRQAEVDGPPEDEAVDEVEPDPEAGYDRPPMLDLVFAVEVGGKDVPEDEAAVLEFPLVAPDAVGGALELDPDPEARAMASAATFVMCTTSTHVPDHWRRESSLGRDFLTVSRHRLLAFLPDSAVTGDGADARLRLTVPPSFELAIETEVTHTLQIGIALEIGGRYYGGLVVSEPYELAIPPLGEDVRLAVEIDAPAHGDAVGRFEIRVLDFPGTD